MKKLFYIVFIFVYVLTFSVRADDVDVEVDNVAPVPIIKIQGDSAYMHVNVTAGESYDSGGDKLTYYWDYGDGHNK